MSTLEPGTRVADRYEVVSLLGSGSTSKVYKAHVLDDRPVAIKILNSQLQLDPQALNRFQHEARVLSRLSHPDIPAVYDFGILPDGGVFLSMQFCRGQTLASKLKEGPVPLQAALDLLARLSTALEKIHETQVIHRGINPEDILVGDLKDGVFSSISLIDFGDAKTVSDASGTPTTISEVFGRAPYLSPEQASGEKTDFTSDIYSLGCVMFEVFTGEVPFLGGSFLATAMKHQSEPTPKLRAVAPERNIPEKMEKVILKMLAKDPKDRYQTASELARDLLKDRKDKKKSWWPF